VTAHADAGRERAAMRLGVVAAIAVALAVAVVARDAAGRRTEAVEGLVEPAWSETFLEARTIRIVSADDTLTIERGATGWTLAERGGYPVDPSALTALHRGLTTLRFSGARTSDPANHARLGVADPATGGEGVRLSVLGANGAPLADWIVGARRAGGWFIRRPDETQAFAATGDLPDLAAPGFWLDLDVLRLNRAELAEVEITPEDGEEPYRLTRRAPTATDFVLTAPAEGYALITAGAANGPGGAAASLRFVDVRPRTTLTTEPAGRHAARTFDGLQVALDIHRDGETEWATIEATAADGAAAHVTETADALAERTAGWAYELPEYAADRMIRGLSGIARPVSDE
jgi:hypothetical protein